MPLGFKQFRAGFFDLQKARSKADRLHLKAQSKFGAYVRRRMKSSVRYKDSRGKAALRKRVRAEQAALDQAKKAGDRVAAAVSRAKLKGLRRQLREIPDPVSEPGKPPFAHRGDSGKSPLRELIFFAHDPATRSVVIGPVAFGKKGARALEFGGPAEVTLPGGRKRAVYIRPRPFVRPAGDAEAKAFPDVLRSTIR